MILGLAPYAMKQNPAWLHFFKRADALWSDHVMDRVAAIKRSIDLEDREGILRYAHEIGWTYADNFTANWGSDPRAKTFLQRFVTSWPNYCLYGSGTDSLQNYMSYLLNMEIRLEQLWSNQRTPVESSWKVYGETDTIPTDYVTPIGGGMDALPPIEYANLMSKQELDTQHIGWQTIDQDPVAGWYPTSSFDIYLDLAQLPTSDVPQRNAEQAVTDLFYELADITHVLRSVVYTIAWQPETIQVGTNAYIEEEYT